MMSSTQRLCSRLTRSLNTLLIALSLLPLLSFSLELGALSSFKAMYASASAQVGFGFGQQIDEVQVKGTQRSEPSLVLKQVQQGGEGATLLPRIIREDLKRIFRLGFYRDVQVDLSEIEGRWILTYIVLEKRSIRAVLYEGNNELGDEELEEVVNLRPFSILNLPSVQNNSNKIKDLYVEKGFFLAEVTWDIVEVEDNQVDVLFRVLEKEEIKVEQIQIIGNQALKDKEIKSFLETREESILSFLSGAGTFNNEAFERDQMRIVQLYYNKGYMQAVVKKPNVSMSPDRSKLYITIAVEEGPRFKVGLVEVSGDLLRPRKELTSLVGMTEGDWFSSEKLRLAMDRLGKIYKDEGYAYVNVIPNTRFVEDLKAIDLDFEIRKGPKVKIGRIEINGNSTTRDKVIRREMRIYEGDEYSSSKIKRSQQLIQRLGFFENVRIDPARSDDPTRMNLNVIVSEKPTGTFQVGAGFSSVENLVGQAQISQNNLFGRGQSLSFQGTVSSLRSMANLRFSENYFMDSRVQFSANVYRFDNNYFNFTRESLGGNLSLGYPITDDFTASGTYTIEKVQATVGGFGVTSSSRQVTPANVFSNGLTSSFRLSLFYDTRNNRIFPSKGTFMSGSIEEASRYLGSTNEFTRYNLRHRYYYSLGANIVLKSNVNWGYITSRSPAGIPIFERFFIGGPLTVRGFFRNSLGPQVEVPIQLLPSSGTTDFIIGGTEQLFFNFEFEFPIFQQLGIRGVGFLDGGNAFQRQDEYLDKLKTFRFAWGFGVRWFSPIGPLRFEWGFPFDPQGTEQDSVFEFSIGNFF